MHSALEATLDGSRSGYDATGDRPSLLDIPGMSGWAPTAAPETIRPALELRVASHRRMTSHLRPCVRLSPAPVIDVEQGLEDEIGKAIDR
jgi:hypothetical protein